MRQYGNKVLSFLEVINSMCYYLIMSQNEMYHVLCLILES
jgi:hypothetical protein